MKNHKKFKLQQQQPQVVFRNLNDNHTAPKLAVKSSFRNQDHYQSSKLYPSQLPSCYSHDALISYSAHKNQP